MTNYQKVSRSLAIIGGGILFAGSVSADVTFSSTADNGSAASNDGNWSGFATYGYDSAYTLTAPAGAGSHYFRTNTGAVSTTIDLSSEAAIIDAGRAIWDFSIWLGSYTGNVDRSQVTVSFKDTVDPSVGKTLGTDVVYDDGTVVKANGQWNYFSLSEAAVPVNARSAVITIDNSAAAGQSGSNDGYADLVSFRLKEASGLGSVLDSAAGTISLSWVAYDLTGMTTPTEIRVTRDGNLIATLAAGVTSYVDSPNAPQTADISYDYRIELYDAGALVVDTGANATVDWPLTGLIADLNAVGDSLTGEVYLNWTAAGAEFQADGIKILRDGVEVAVLALNARTYSETPPTPPYTYNYTVRAYGGWQGGAHTDLTSQVSVVKSDLTSGLVANYRFEDGFKDTASSANQHNGAALNGATISGNGVYGHCLTLQDQLKQGMQAPDHASLDFGSATDFTVSFWMRRVGSMNSSVPNGEAGDGVLICKQNWGNGATPGWGVYATGDGGVQWNLAGSSRKTGTIATGASGLADDRWHHILISSTRTGSSRYFVDGAYTGSTSISGAGSVDNSLPLSMGVDSLGKYSWKGHLDEVALWNRSLSDAEAADVFRASKKGLALSGTNVVDSDGDKMSDDWEMAHFGNLNQTAEGDFDHDGKSNFKEYADGDDPASGRFSAVSRVTNEEVDGQTYPVLHYTRPALDGDVSYLPEASSDLSNWTSGEGEFIPFGNPTDLSADLREYHVRYYRSLDAVQAGRVMLRVRMESRYQAAIAGGVTPTVELRNGQAIVTWRTSEPTVTIINYESDGETATRYENYTPTTYHEVVIDLAPGKEFTYTVIQIDENGAETRSKTYTVSSLWDYSPPAVSDQFGYDSGSGWSARADEILAIPGVIDRGYCLDYLCGDGRLAYELARKSQIVVIGVEDTQAEVDAARAFLVARGIYGSRVTVVLASDLAKLPFPKDFFNLIVSQSQVAAGSDFTTFKNAVTIHSIPNRGSVVGLDGATMTSEMKPVNPGTGSWTMAYGSPANTSSSVEEFNGKTTMSDFELRWLGSPGPELAWDRQLAEQPPLAVNGRFYCQGKGRLLALDSHNGSVLWSRELDDAQRFNVLRDAGNLSADDDAVWLSLRQECWKMEGDTGKLTVFPLVKGSRGDLDYCWNYICSTGDHLLGTSSIDKAFYKDHWGGQFWYVNAGGSLANQVVSDNLFSLDRSTGVQNWNYEDGLILGVTITVANGKIYFLETRNPTAVSGNSRRLGTSTWKTNLFMVCLDLATGNKVWEQASSFSGGTQTVFLMYDEVSDKLILSAGNGTNYLYAFNPATGSQVWSKSASVFKGDHGGKNQHPVISNGEILLTPHVYDAVTGDLKRSGIPSTGGCNTYWGSKNMLFYRTGYGGQGLSMWPQDGTGSTTGIDHIKGACWLSWAPADGMFLIQEKSAGCSCGAWIHISLGWGPK